MQQTISGVDINYEIVGTHGPWVALMSSGRRGYQELLPLSEKIVSHGFRVLLHDRRNTGASGISINAEKSEVEVWAEDLHELLSELNVSPIFVGGSSSGARTAIEFGLRYPNDVHGLLLLRISGGEFAAKKLPEFYYGRFIRIVEEGGMAALCETDAFREKIEANPTNLETLMNPPPEYFISTMSKLRDLMIKNSHLPVMDVTEEELQSIEVPTIIISGNDEIHTTESSEAAHRAIRGSVIHKLSIIDFDVPIDPFDQWTPYEKEISNVFSEFMKDTLVEEYRELFGIPAPGRDSNVA